MRHAYIHKWLDSQSDLSSDDTEPELPSSSQFYFLSNIEDDYMFNLPFLCESEELQNTSFPSRYPNGPSRYPNGSAGIEHISSMQEQVNAPTLGEKGKSCRKETTDFNLLTDECTSLKNNTEDSENSVGNYDVKLDMQDKELEAIIASIAELCGLNVTRNRAATRTKRFDNGLAVYESFNHGKYGLRPSARRSENYKMKREMNSLQFEIDNEMKERHVNDEDEDEKLQRELEDLKSEIRMEEERSKRIQQELIKTRNDYTYLKKFTNAEPRNTPNDKSNVGKLTLSKTTQPVFDGYNKLSPIAGSRSVSTTPRPENIPKHMYLSTSKSTWSACLTPCTRNAKINSDDNDSNNNFIIN